MTIEGPGKSPASRTNATDRSGKLPGGQRQVERRTEEQLRTALEELERYKSVVSKSRTLVFVWRVAPGVWPVELVSDNLEDVLGYTADDLMSGRVSWPEITHPEDVGRVEAEVAACLKAGQSEWSQEYRLVMKSGQIRWFAHQKSVLRSPGGQITHVQSFALDITDRKRAEEKLAQYQKRIEGLTSALSSAEDRERRRVAEGLHDCVAQGLGAMNLHLQVLRDAELSEGQAAALDESLGLLKQMGTAVRTMTFELYPPTLHEMGLAPALSWLVEQHSRGHPAEFRFEDDGQAKPLSDETAGAVFRAVRELLRNAVRHADPRHVNISSAREGDVLRICVESDGIGFDPTSVDLAGREGAGFGLFSIRERMKHLGGRFEIESSPGCGSRFTLLVPTVPKTGEEPSATGIVREPCG